MLIETERLILRTFTEDDAADVLEYLREPSVHCFASMRLDSLDAAKDEMKQRKGDELYLAIVLKETGKVIGESFAHPESNEPDDEIMDTFSPCWMLNLNYSGKEYAYEAAKAYFDYLFNEKGARRIYAYLRIIISRPSGCVKDSACGARDSLWNSSASSIIPTGLRFTRTRCSMLF